MRDSLTHIQLKEGEQKIISPSFALDAFVYELYNVLKACIVFRKCSVHAISSPWMQGIERHIFKQRSNRLAVLDISRPVMSFV